MEHNRTSEAAELAWLDVMHERDWPHLPQALAVMIGPKRRQSPPLAAADPTQWLRPVETPKELLNRLAVREIMPPSAERSDASEFVTDLSQASTPTLK